MVIHNVEQNTQEWYELRLGVPTASNFKMIFDKDGNPSKQRQKYMYQLFDEIISGEMSEGYYNNHMAKGHEMEAESLRAYEMKHGVELERVGFIMHDSGLFGCSPDALVKGEKIGVETKNAAPHIQYERLNSWSGAEHQRQVMGSLLVTGYEKWVLRSYCRNMPAVEIVFERDEALLNKFYVGLKSFCAELQDMTVKFK